MSSQKETKKQKRQTYKSQLFDSFENEETEDRIERNFDLKDFFKGAGYFLQTISIILGTYLAYMYLNFIYPMDYESPSNAFINFMIIIVILLAFFSLEYLKRTQIHKIGDHKKRSLKIEDKQISHGEWRITRTVGLIFISLLSVATGTYGFYSFVLNSQQEAPTLSVDEVVKTEDKGIAQEQKIIASLDEAISKLRNEIKQDLANRQNFAVWNNVKVLMPEVKKKHESYLKQIEATQEQRKLHKQDLSLLQKRRFNKEDKTQVQNQEISTAHDNKKEYYATIGFGIWLVLELSLLYFVAYPYILEYQAKHDFLLAKLNIPQKPLPKNQTSEIPKNEPLQEVFYKDEFIKYALNRPLSIPEDRVSTNQLDKLLDGYPDKMDKKLWTKLVDRLNYAELSNKQNRLNKLKDLSKEVSKSQKWTEKNGNLDKEKKESINFTSQKIEDFLSKIYEQFQDEIKHGYVSLEEIEAIVQERCPSGMVTETLETIIVRELKKFIEEVKQEDNAQKISHFQNPKNGREKAHNGQEIDTPFGGGGAIGFVQTYAIEQNQMNQVGKMNKAKRQKKYHLSEQEIYELIGQYSYREIAEMAGCSKSHVSNVKKRVEADIKI